SDLDTGELGPLPLTGLERVVRWRDVAGAGQQQGDGLLGGADDVGGRRVDHHHATSGGGGDVDVVQTDSSPSHHLQPRRRGQHLLVHPSSAAHQQRVGVRDGTQQGGAVGAIDLTYVEIVREHVD